MVQTVLRTLEMPQLQFVARWSMSSSCWCCRFHRCISWTRLWTCPLCAMSGAGRDCAQNCGGLRSCSCQPVRRLRRLRTKFSYFLRDGELGSGVRFSLWKSGFHELLVSGSHCVYIRQLPSATCRLVGSMDQWALAWWQRFASSCRMADFSVSALRVGDCECKSDMQWHCTDVGQGST